MEKEAKSWLQTEIKKQEIDKYFELLNSYPIERMPSFSTCRCSYNQSFNREVFNMTIPGKIQFILHQAFQLLNDGEGANVIKQKH